MTLTERQLEEDEARLDNILHKILKASEQMRLLTKEIGSEPQKNYLVRDKFELLSGTISNLALLADEITLHEEKITEELEDRIQNELGEAIVKIKEIKELFEEPS